MILLVLLIAAASPNAPVAIGPTASVVAATRAARACGMRDIWFDPLDDKRAMLLIGSGNKTQAVDCTLGWIKRNWDAMGYEPLVVGNLRR